MGPAPSKTSRALLELADKASDDTTGGSSDPASEMDKDLADYLDSVGAQPMPQFRSRSSSAANSSKASESEVRARAILSYLNSSERF